MMTEKKGVKQRCLWLVSQSRIDVLAASLLCCKFTPISSVVLSAGLAVCVQLPRTVVAYSSPENGFQVCHICICIQREAVLLEESWEKRCKAPRGESEREAVLCKEKAKRRTE